MQYDPIKDILFRAVTRYPYLRKVFFFLLDKLFLRQWYVKKHITRLMAKLDKIDFYDAGAGFCQYSDFVLSNYSDSHVLALDLKDDYLKDYAKYADEKFPGRFNWISEDLVTYKPGNIFNLVVAIDILEHIEDDVQAMKNMYLALSAGGKLIISTPSETDEAARFTSEHVRPGYAMKDLIGKLKQTGFEILISEYSYGRWGRISWKLGIKLPLLLVSYSKLLLLLLPIYYLCLYPIIYLLMLVDISSSNKTGNGIIIVAEKPVSAF
jgi:SAM-dependent methyltransferase